MFDSSTRNEVGRIMVNNDFYTVINKEGKEVKELFGIEKVI